MYLTKESGKVIHMKEKDYEVSSKARNDESVRYVASAGPVTTITTPRTSTNANIFFQNIFDLKISEARKTLGTIGESNKIGVPNNASLLEGGKGLFSLFSSSRFSLPSYPGPLLLLQNLNINNNNNVSSMEQKQQKQQQQVLHLPLSALPALARKSLNLAATAADNNSNNNTLKNNNQLGSSSLRRSTASSLLLSQQLTSASLGLLLPSNPPPKLMDNNNNNLYNNQTSFRRRHQHKTTGGIQNSFSSISISMTSPRITGLPNINNNNNSNSNCNCNNTMTPLVAPLINVLSDSSPTSFVPGLRSFGNVDNDNGADNDAADDADSPALSGDGSRNIIILDSPLVPAGGGGFRKDNDNNNNMDNNNTNSTSLNLLLKPPENNNNNNSTCNHAIYMTPSSTTLINVLPDSSPTRFFFPVSRSSFSNDDNENGADSPALSGDDSRNIIILGSPLVVSGFRKDNNNNNVSIMDDNNNKDKDTDTNNDADNNNNNMYNIIAENKDKDSNHDNNNNNNHNDIDGSKEVAEVVEISSSSPSNNIESSSASLLQSQFQHYGALSSSPPYNRLRIITSTSAAPPLDVDEDERALFSEGEGKCFL